MIKLITYTNDGDELFDFSFNKDSFKISHDGAKSFIETNTQKIYIADFTTVCYDEDILLHKNNPYSNSIAKSLIQSYYKDNRPILYISTKQGIPLFLFVGDEIHHDTSADNHISEYFTIDGKTICTTNCNWLVIIKKKPA